jgi:hypothetical protein
MSEGNGKLVTGEAGPKISDNDIFVGNITHMD